jgi:hypothetical protein
MAVKAKGTGAVREDASQFAGEMHLKMRNKTFKVIFDVQHARGTNFLLFGASQDDWKVSYKPDPALATIWQLEGRSPYEQLTKKLRTAFRQHIKENGLLGQMQKLWAKEFPDGPAFEFHGISCPTLYMHTSLRDIAIDFSAHVAPYNTPAKPIYASMSHPFYQQFDFSTPKEAVAGIKKEYEAAQVLIKNAEKSSPEFFARADRIKKQLGPDVIVEHAIDCRTKLPEHTTCHWKGASGEYNFIVLKDGSIASYQPVINSKNLNSLEKVSQVLDFYRFLEKGKEASQDQGLTPSI